MKISPLPLSNRVAGLHRSAVELWHLGLPIRPKDPLERLVLDQHWFNYELWHQEDEARRTDVPDSVIAQVKRNIDGLNQGRNDAIEKIDAWLLEYLKPVIRKSAELHSETAGSIIDRLSILALRIHHMKEQARRKRSPAGHAFSCRQKLKVLLEQEKDLLGCLNALLKRVMAGKSRFKLYRRFKMYNDPLLNPALYLKQR